MLDFDVTRTDTIIWMMQHKPWDLLACVLKTPDTVHHEVWHIIDPTHPRYDAELNRQFAPAVLDYFNKIDDCVGRIIAAAPPDAFVAIMSDHGGGPFQSFMSTTIGTARSPQIQAHAAESVLHACSAGSAHTTSASSTFQSAPVAGEIRARAQPVARLFCPSAMSIGRAPKPLRWATSGRSIST
jgi:hypothetical protein